MSQVFAEYFFIFLRFTNRVT